eukprot:GHVR01124727.1.p2 GENE.GHVR01124727.1~~GHVR01124727.1.p2  ORF type:complete len:121 (+),score=16.77 GHVR01124727.1:692-1054(+)
MLIVDASSEFLGGKLYPGNGRLTVNLSGPHNTTTKQLKGQNSCEAEAVRKGVEKAHEVLVLQRNSKAPYALKVYSDNMAVIIWYKKANPQVAHHTPALNSTQRVSPPPYPPSGPLRLLFR